MLYVAGSNPAARSEKQAVFVEGEGEQKALALPKPPVPLPARPVVRVLDLLRAIDGAAVAGDLFAVRALTAAAVRQLEGDAADDDSEADATPGTEGGAS